MKPNIQWGTILTDMFVRIDGEARIERPFQPAKGSSKKTFVNNFKQYRKAHRAKKG